LIITASREAAEAADLAAMLGLDAGVVGGGDDSLRAAMVKSKTKRQNEFESMAAMLEAKCVTSFFLRD
tara:strand:- start:1 stop:204 length:204 start_codon:yes stop_codon:yes gene_type:complete